MGRIPKMMPESHTTHPDVLALAAYVDGELDAALESEVRAHLEVCVQCRLRVAGIADAEPIPTEPLAQSPRVPQGLLEAFALPAGGEPAVGELWRVTGPEEAMLVWVQRTMDDFMRVIPSTFDTELADEYTLVVGKEDSPFGLDLALHTTLEAELPREVFRERLGALDVASAIERVRDARRSGRPAPSDLLVGYPIVDSLDERLAFRESLASSIGAIAAVGSELDEILEETAPVDDVTDLKAHCRRIEAEVRAWMGIRRKTAKVVSVTYPPVRTSVGLVQPVVAVEELALQVLVCAVSVKDSALLSDRSVVGAAGTMIRSSIATIGSVALVASDSELTTQIRDLADTSPTVVDAPSGVVGAPRPGRAMQALADAIIQVLEEMGPTFEKIDGDVLESDQRIDFDLLTLQVSEVALEGLRTTGAKIKEKKSAYQTLGQRPPSELAEILRQLRAGRVDVRTLIEDQLERIGRAS